MSAVTGRRRVSEAEQQPLSRQDSRITRIGGVALSAVAMVAVVSLASKMICDEWQERRDAANAEVNEMCGRFEDMQIEWRNATRGCTVEESGDDFAVEQRYRSFQVCQRVDRKYVPWPYCVKGDQHAEEWKFREQQRQEQWEQCTGRMPKHRCYRLRTYKPSSTDGYQRPSNYQEFLDGGRRREDGRVYIRSDMPGAPVSRYTMNHQVPVKVLMCPSKQALQEQWSARKAQEQKCQEAYEKRLDFTNRRPAVCFYKPRYR